MPEKNWYTTGWFTAGSEDGLTEDESVQDLARDQDE